jgi:hypothetical protein
VWLLTQTWLWAAANVSVLGVILFISTWRNPPGAGDGGGGLPEWLPAAAHLAMYATLAVLLVGLLLTSGRVGRLWIILGASFAGSVGYGAAMELVQRRISERAGSWVDVGWNSLGAGIALAAVYLVLTAWRLRRGSPS